MGDADSETIIGSNADDVIDAQGGDDRIEGGYGNDIINGWTGVDTAVYAGDNTRYDMSSNANDAIIITGNGTGTDTDTLTYIDIIEISGVAFATSGSAPSFTAGADHHIGGNAGETFSALGGDDVLYGLGGDDTLIGGTGADQLFGGNGSDILYTEGSDTLVSGGFGYDYLIVANSVAGGTWAASDIEEWYGNAGNETFDATGAVDRVIMIANEGNDTLIGGFEADVLLGGSGNDIVSGGLGNDDLFGNAGADEIYGGGGSDIIRFDADDTVVNGGADYDYALAEGSAAVTLSLTNGAFEFAVGTSASDQLSAENATWHVTIYGGGGNDTIYAGNAGSYLRGQAGQDSLVGGAGADYFDGGADADVIWMQNNGGTDYAYGFEDGTDFVNLSLITGVSGFGDITVDSSGSAGGWFSVDYGSGTLWLQAGSGATIDANDFIFAVPLGQEDAPEAQSSMPDMLAAGDVNTPLPEAVDLDQFIFDDAAFVAGADEALDAFSDAAFGEAQAVEAMAAWCDANDLSEIGDPELPDMFVHPEDIGYFDWG